MTCVVVPLALLRLSFRRIESGGCGTHITGRTVEKRCRNHIELAVWSGSGQATPLFILSQSDAASGNASAMSVLSLSIPAKQLGFSKGAEALLIPIASLVPFDGMRKERPKAPEIEGVSIVRPEGKNLARNLSREKTITLIGPGHSPAQRREEKSVTCSPNCARKYPSRSTLRGSIHPEWIDGA